MNWNGNCFAIGENWINADNIESVTDFIDSERSPFGTKVFGFGLILAVGAAILSSQSADLEYIGKLFCVVGGAMVLAGLLKFRRVRWTVQLNYPFGQSTAVRFYHEADAVRFLHELQAVKGELRFVRPQSGVSVGFWFPI